MAKTRKVNIFARLHADGKQRTLNARLEAEQKLTTKRITVLRTLAATFAVPAVPKPKINIEKKPDAVTVPENAQ